MLLQEIGRFGDNIEELSVMDIKDDIPKELLSSNVGIFWHVGDNQFIIRKCNILDDNNVSVEMGDEYDFQDNPDDIQIDYNHFHKDIWAEIKNYNKYSWEHFSRGRILFEVSTGKMVIYAPPIFKAYNNVQNFLCEQFNIPKDRVEFNYTIYKNKQDVLTLSVFSGCESIE